MRRRLLALAASATLLLSACGTVGVDAAATVGGVTISNELLLSAMTENQLAREGDALLAAQREQLTSLVISEGLWQLAALRGIVLTDEDVEEQLEIDAALAGVTVEEYFAQIAEANDVSRRRIRDAAREQVALTAMREQLIADIEVDPDAVRAAYDANPARWDTVEAVHILVSTEEEAEDVLDRLADGEDFGDLARELSIDTGSGALGGVLGAAPPTNYVEPFRDAVVELPLGELSEPVQTQFGFHIIRVDARETIPFEDAEEQLRNEILGQSVELQNFIPDVIADFKALLDIDVNSRIGAWDPTVDPVGIVVAESVLRESRPTPAPLEPGDTGQ